MDTPEINNQNTPYANLNPNVILNAIESAGFRCSGSLFALNSYENRVYQIGIEDGEPLIAKFYRPGRWSDAAILEEHSFALELMALEIAVVAPIVTDNKTLHHYEEFRFSLFPRKGGRTLEVDNPEHLEWMGRFIGRMHAVGTCGKFLHRPQLNVENNGYIPHQFLLDNNYYPDSLRNAFLTTTEALLIKTQQRFDHAGNIKNIRLHGDCHVGNILWSDAGPQIVDLDDCLTGPAIQDLWMLISGNNEDQVNSQMNDILAGYTEFFDFDYREIHLIEALRTLRMIAYSAWLARRWEDPAFPPAFPWFNSLHYWQTHLEDLREQEMLLDRLSENDIL
jgi:Ser/Thr protein kinase RdoA (MazF antagonist)